MSLLNLKPLAFALSFERRSGFEPVGGFRFHEFRRGERVVGMKQEGGTLFVMTNQVIYEMGSDTLVPVDLAQPIVGNA